MNHLQLLKEMVEKRMPFSSRPIPFQEDRAKGHRVYVDEEYRIVPEGTENASKIIVQYRDPKNGYKEVDPGTPGAIAYRRFWGYPSTNKVDIYRTIVETDAVIEAWPEYVKHGNVRLMHNHIVVGRIFIDSYEIRSKGIYAGVSIPLHQTEVLKDIDAGLIQCFSLGWNTKPGGVTWAEGPSEFTRFTEITITEITLCDSGATPDTDIKGERKKGLVDRMTTLFEEYGFKRRSKEGSENQPDSGGNPDDTEEFPMEKKELETLLDNQKEAIVEGVGKAFGDVMERFMKDSGRSDEGDGKEKQEQRSRNGEPPATPPADPNAPVTIDAIRQLISPIQEQVTNLQRSMTNNEPLSPVLDSMGASTEEIEKLVQQASDGQSATDDDFNLSFVRQKDGNPLTLDTLARNGNARFIPSRDSK